MRKICVFILTVLMVFNLAACSETAAGSSSKTTSTVSTGSKDESSTTANTNTQTESENGVVTICTSSTPPLLKQAAERYHQLNPGVTVEIKEYLPVKVTTSGNTSVQEKPSDEQVEKYINTVNTELMGGKGADIIMLDQKLPYQKYVDKNMFMDIDKFMQQDKDFNNDKYFMNIFKAMEYKNGLYAMPIDFYFSMMTSVQDMSAYDSTWTYEDFFNLSQKAITESKNKFKYITRDSDSSLFDGFFKNSCRSFVNYESKTSQFNSDKFINLLKKCKEMSDKGLLGKADSDIFKTDVMLALHSPQQIYTASVMKLVTTKSPDNNKTFLSRFPTLDGSKSVAFDTMSLYAINKNSPNTNKSWKFLKFLLSEEMQSSASIGGFSIQKDAYKKNQKEYFKMMFQNLPENEITSLNDQYSAAAEKVILDINTYSQTDPRIYKTVIEEANSFFKGQRSAEDAAKNIQNKVTTYLNE